MKNKKKILLVIIILFTLSFETIYAEDIIPPLPPEPVNIHLTIKTDTESIYDQDINVNACNSDNASTPDLKVTAYCAILQSGIQNDWNWDWAPGAFLNSLNNIAGYTSQDVEGNDVYHYWSWYLNEVEGTIALNQYELQSNDLILLNFIDPIETIVEIITPEIEEESYSSGSNSTSSSKKEEKEIFDTTKALEFLASEQKENGSFGEDLYTDWITISIASIENQNQKIESIIKLVRYFGEFKTSSTLLTDFERHTMALMTLGLNPYNTNGENYIKKIIDNFDETQFGDINQDNDDIFALIILQNAGYSKEDKIIQATIDFILSKQKENGSWDESIDMTGAGIQALSLFQEEEKMKTALEKAKEFLKQNQKETGGWDNISSTSWAIGGILALSEKPEDWIKNNNSPLNYLAENQDTDGGIKNEYLQNKIWETAYALSALSLKTWNQIMQKFEKPKEEIMLEEKEDLEQKLEKVLTILEEIKTENKTIKLALAKNNTTQSSQNVVKKENIEKENKTTKTENLSIQNTATIINALEENENKQKEKNWLSNFLSKVFSVF